MVFSPTFAADQNHELSPDAGSDHVSSTPPTSFPVERSFSSASKHYLSLSRLNSIFPVSRSSSESSAPLPFRRSKVDVIQDSINRVEKVWHCVLCVHSYCPARGKVIFMSLICYLLPWEWVLLSEEGTCDICPKHKKKKHIVFACLWEIENMSASIHEFCVGFNRYTNHTKFSITCFFFLRLEWSIVWDPMILCGGSLIDMVYKLCHLFESVMVLLQCLLHILTRLSC